MDGDIATAIFMILDDTEKYGWNDRNSKREYFAHCEALIAQERSLIRVIELLAKECDKPVDFNTAKNLISSNTIYAL